jgi:hypothetical protein
MAQRKIIVACKVFEDELRASLPEDQGFEIVWIDAGLHADLDALEKELERVLGDVSDGAADIRIFFGSGCHPEIQRLARRFGATIAPVKNCIQAFCGEQTKELETNRTMIMTPGWIRAWPSIMDAQGWDEVDARINMGIYDRILLLDAGINPLSDEEILEFFDLVQVPVDIQPLDLDCFRRTLREVLS